MTEYRSTRSQPPRKPDSEYTAFLHHHVGPTDQPYADVWIVRGSSPYGKKVMSASTTNTIADMHNPRAYAASQAEIDALITDAGFVLTGEWESDTVSPLQFQAPCAIKERESS